MSVELLNCPFCGGRAELNRNHDSDSENFDGHYIECVKCQASTALRFACGDDPVPLLVEQWNRRASRSEGWQDISTAPKDGTGIATYWQERWNMSRSKQEVFAALLFHYCSVSQSLGTAGSAPPQQGAHIKTDAEIRYDAKHDNSCIGAFARARPTRVPK